MPGGQRFEGRVAVVFGASRPPGMGRETAFVLADEGAAVACIEDTSGYVLDENGTTPAQLAEVVDEVRRRGARTLGIEVDLTDAGAVDAAVASVVAEWGRVDVAACLMIETGPGLSEGPLLDFDPSGWRACLERNLTSVWLANRAVGRHMVRQGAGSIVNLSTEASRGIPPGHGAYVAAKAGVEAMGRVLARELGPSGVRVNTISPLAVFDTAASAGVARLAAATGMDFDSWIEKTIPLGRNQHPRELAAVVASLLSTDMGFVSGEVVYLTGGAL